MLVVHHLNESRSQRILWLLEELGTPYEIAQHMRDAKTRLAPPELKAIHPLGKSPVIVDGANTVAESGAIVEYLLDACPGTPLRPAPGTPDFLRYRYWLHFAEGSAMPPLLLKLIFERIKVTPMPFFVNRHDASTVPTLPMSVARDGVAVFAIVGTYQTRQVPPDLMPGGTVSAMSVLLLGLSALGWYA